MNIGVEEFCKCIEDCYCDKVIQIDTEDEDGNTTIVTDCLISEEFEEYIHLEDDNGLMSKIRKNNILSIEKQPYENDEELIITTRIRFYKFKMLKILKKEDIW